MIELRPHHGLCIRFFEGKGYSSEFTRHMQETIGRLKETGTQVILVEKEDEICQKCPNFLENGCKSADRVKAYDRAVLKMTGLPVQTPVEYRKLQQEIEEKIVNTGRMCEICQDCGWAHICHR